MTDVKITLQKTTTPRGSTTIIQKIEWHQQRHQRKRTTKFRAKTNDEFVEFVKNNNIKLNNKDRERMFEFLWSRLQKLFIDEIGYIEDIHASIANGELLDAKCKTSTMIAWLRRQQGV